MNRLNILLNNMSVLGINIEPFSPLHHGFEAKVLETFLSSNADEMTRISSSDGMKMVDEDSNNRTGNSTIESVRIIRSSSSVLDALGLIVNIRSHRLAWHELSEPVQKTLQSISNSNPNLESEKKYKLYLNHLHNLRNGESIREIS